MHLKKITTILIFTVGFSLPTLAQGILFPEGPCRSEVNKICGEARPMRSCMEAKKSQLSPKCQAVVTEHLKQAPHYNGANSKPEAAK